jgi:site-specific DNA recombinase
VVRRLSENGELDRGLRSIDPERAAVVRRIFEAYAGGTSPRRIALQLNADGIAGPGGGIWYDASIRGRPKRHDGILRNDLYVGRIVWRRRVNSKDPTSGATVRRDAKPESFVYADAPSLRIIDDALWQRVQHRLAEDAAPETPGRLKPRHAFWDRRRPRPLLSQKVECGVCGRLFSAVGKDYLGCTAAKNGGCRNTRTVRRVWLEAHVMELLRRQLMQPELLEKFLETIRVEWDRLASELKDQGGSWPARTCRPRPQDSEPRGRDQRRPVKPGDYGKVEEPGGGQSRNRGPEHTAAIPPMFDTPPAAAYGSRIKALTTALERGDDPNALELARTLIEKVVIHPPQGDDDPPGIELIGELMALLAAAGVEGAEPDERAPAPDPVLGLFVSSVKAGPGAEPLAFILPPRRPHADFGLGHRFV